MGGRGPWMVAILGAIVLRIAAGWPLVSGPEALPFPDDAPYHWIRLARLIEHPVDVQARDLESAYPEGVRAHWPWGFDLGLAALVRLAQAAGETSGDYRVASWAIPLLGALLLPLVGVLARRLARPGMASIAVALVAVMPFHVQYSMAGRVDHHVLEPITLAVALLGLLPGTPLSGAGLCGLAQGLAFALFPSALFPVLVVMALGGPTAALRRPVATSLWAIGTSIGAAASLSLSPYANEWAFFAPSRTHLVLTGCCALGILGTAVARVLAPRNGAGLALVVGGMAAFLSGLILWAIFPPWFDSFRQGIAYLTRSGFARLSFEARPLLADPLRAWMLLGCAAPLGMAGLWRLAFSREPFTPEVVEARRLVALLALALGAGALLQRRFVMVAVPLLAIPIAEGLSWAGNRVRSALARWSVRQSLVTTLMAAMLVGILVQDARQSLALAPWLPRDQAFLEAGRHMAQRVRESPIEARRGVLAPWSAGHLVRWASGMPVVCDNFFGAPDHDQGLRNCLAFLLETDETTITAMLSRLRVRFVLVLPPHPEEVRVMGALMGLPEGSLVDDQDRFTTRFARTAWVRLGRFAASAAVGSRGPLGSILTHMVRVRNPATGQVEAEVAVLEFPEVPGPTDTDRPAAEPLGGQGLYPEAGSEENAARRTTGGGP